MRGWKQGVSALLLVFSQPSLSDCTVSALSTSFGAYDTFSAVPLDAAGQVTVTCQFLIGVLVGYTVQLGTGSSGSYSTRSLSGSGYQLDYNLYVDSARSTVWGDGSGGTTTVNDGYLITLLLPYERNYTVYGRIPAAQNVPPGSYSDTIVVTVNY